MAKALIKLYFSVFFTFLLVSVASSQSADSLCTYPYEKEWLRIDVFDSTCSLTYTFFHHKLPDSSEVGYIDFDENGVKYLDSAYSLLKKYHYNPYRNISPSDLDSLYLSTRERIASDSAINPKKFYRLLREFVVAIGDAHTSLSFEDYSLYMEHGGHLLPFSVTIKDDKIYIDQVYGDPLLRSKDQILEINGIGDRDLLEQMKKLAFADLERPEFKIRGITEDFDFLLWVIQEQSTPCFHLKLKREPDTLSFTPHGLTIAEFPTVEEYLSEYVAFVSHGQRKVALLSLPSLLFDGEKRKFRKRIREMFKAIRERSIDTLIIDIRNNPGGTCDNYLYLMKYLVPRDSLMEIKIEARASKKKKKRHGDYFIFVHNKERGVKSKKRFSGTTILLTNSNTYSAAGNFADYFKAYKVGQVIGAPHSNVNDFGSPVRFWLGDSLIDLYIPRAKFISPGWIKTGSAPDIIIDPHDYLDVLGDEWVVEWMW